MKVIAGPAHEMYRALPDSPAHYLLERWLIGVSRRTENRGGSLRLCSHVRSGVAAPALKFGLACWDPGFTVDFLECAACLADRWQSRVDYNKGWDTDPKCDFCRAERRKLLPAFAIFGSVAVFGVLCVDCHSDSCGVRDGN